MVQTRTVPGIPWRWRAGQVIHASAQFHVPRMGMPTFHPPGTDLGGWVEIRHQLSGSSVWYSGRCHEPGGNYGPLAGRRPLCGLPLLCPRRLGSRSGRSTSTSDAPVPARGGPGRLAYARGWQSRGCCSRRGAVGQPAPAPGNGVPPITLDFAVPLPREPWSYQGAAYSHRVGGRYPSPPTRWPGLP